MSCFLHLLLNIFLKCIDEAIMVKLTFIKYKRCTFIKLVLLMLSGAHISTGDILKIQFLIQ